MATSTSTKTFFNLTVSGIGYMRRIRKVPAQGGNDFWACDISALRGDSSKPEYTNFDCRISGSEAEKLTKSLQKADNEKKKILVGFKLGDVYPDTFTYLSGAKKGETGVSLKARLFGFTFIKIDGDTIFKASPSNQSSVSDDDGGDGRDNWSDDESF